MSSAEQKKLRHDRKIMGAFAAAIGDNMSPVEKQLQTLRKEAEEKAAQRTRDVKANKSFTENNFGALANAARSMKGEVMHGNKFNFRTADAENDVVLQLVYSPADSCEYMTKIPHLFVKVSEDRNALIVRIRDKDGARAPYEIAVKNNNLNTAAKQLTAVAAEWMIEINATQAYEFQLKLAQLGNNTPKTAFKK